MFRPTCFVAQNRMASDGFVAQNRVASDCFVPQNRMASDCFVPQNLMASDCFLPRPLPPDRAVASSPRLHTSINIVAAAHNMWNVVVCPKL